MSDTAWHEAPHRAAVGRLGEDAAWNFLKAQGYTLLHRNWRSGRFELDIVARDPQGVLVFVEVKSNRRTDFGSAAERVDGRKRLRIQRLAQAYVRTFALSGDMRFDVIGIETTSQGPVMTHYTNAFLPSTSGYFGF